MSKQVIESVAHFQKNRIVIFVDRPFQLKTVINLHTRVCLQSSFMIKKKYRFIRPTLKDRRGKLYQSFECTRRIASSSFCRSFTRHLVDRFTDISFKLQVSERRHKLDDTDNDYSISEMF